MDSDATKREFIEAFFEELERKVEFLSELNASGHDDEAQLLALVYLDGLANWLRHPSTASARNFSVVLIRHGGDQQFGLVIPRWLLKALPWKKAPTGARAAIEGALQPLLSGEAYSVPGLLELLGPVLAEPHLEWLANEVWRGSVANAVYVSLRCPGVHQLSSGHGISFAETKWQGEVLDRVGLERLLAALARVAAHAKTISLETNDWFGIV